MMNDDLLIKAAFDWCGSILITGEPGTGKTRRAREIARKHSARELVEMNTGELHEDLIASHLFGFVRGAFTGANQAAKGFVERANGGALFIDEIGEFPLAAQAKLLRCIDEGLYSRVGDTGPPARSRFTTIAATNRDLHQMVKAGTFRFDLLDRLMGCQVRLVPLRERGQTEVARLAGEIIAEQAASKGLTAPTITVGALAILKRYRWPGNARELRQVAQVLISHGSADEAAVRRVMGDRLKGGGTPLEVFTMLVARLEWVTSADFAGSFGCRSSQARALIAGMVNAGLATKEKRGRQTFYTLSRRSAQ